MDAIVLAGAPADEKMRPREGYTSRGMVEVGGKTMLQWIVDAIKASGRVERVTVIGDAAADGVDAVLPAGEGFLENIMLGISRADSQERLLIACSDIPLVTAEAISDFIERSEALEADFCYPIIPKEECLRKYPGISRTYLRTREGTFTGGNLVVVSPEFMRHNEEAIMQAYMARKRVFSLAKMIGFGTLLRAIAAQLLFPRLLTVPQLERAVGRMVSGTVRAVVTEYPEIGEDVDKPEDLEQIQAVLAARAAVDLKSGGVGR